MDKISVIIPVYKVEKYLRRCVESILCQTYENLEIILVDDGSPDSCPQICDEYASKDNRIKVIHKPNGGLSSARNVGIQIASGKYISFVDSDDWIDPNTYYYCYNLINKYNSEVVQFSMSLVCSEEKLTNPREKIQVFEGKEILQFYLSSTLKYGGYSVCRCLFQTDKVKQVKFREGKINEDIDFKYKVLQLCNRLVLTNQSLYYYWKGGVESISIGGLNRKDLDLVEAGNVLYSLTKDEKYGDIAYLGRVKQARSYLSLLCKIAYYGIADSTIDKEKIVQQMQDGLRQNLKLLLFSPIPLNRKILSVCFSINYLFTEKLIHLIRK